MRNFPTGMTMDTTDSFHTLHTIPAENRPVNEIVESLLEQAWSLRLTDTARAASLLDRARLIIPQPDTGDTSQADALLRARINTMQARLCYILAEYPAAERWVQEASVVYEQYDNEAGRAAVLEILGLIQWSTGIQAHSLENLLKSLILYLRLGKKEAEARVLNSIGLVYNKLGDFGKALEFMLQALSIHQELGDRVSEYRCIGNLGIIYAEHGNYTTALEYYHTCLAYEQSNGDARGMCRAFNNIGVTYTLMKDYARALEYLIQGLQLLQETDDKNGIGTALCNIAEAYIGLEDYKQAYIYAAASLDIRENIGDKPGMASSLICLGDLLTRIEEYDEALECLQRALTYSRELDTAISHYSTHERLYALYRKIGNTGAALEHLEQFHALKQKVYNDDNNRKLAALQTLRQVEAAKKEAEIHRLRNVELTGINEQLQTLNREKNEMMGIVAHDLKNPLAGILLLARTLHNSADTIEADEIREYTADIQTTVSRMFDLITDLLDISRIETQGVSVQYRECDLSELVLSTVKNHKAYAATKSISIECTTQSLHSPVTTDERLLSQIIDNILSNAIKFSFPDTTVHVSLDLEGSRARITIRDEGPGLTPEDKKKLFHKFARLSARPTGNEHSTGLGLSIVKKLVEALAGKVQCESEPGMGTAFIVDIPTSQTA
jgi:signal transduction histidine kinase